ncbi:BRD4-interacting chromatin-remodeling complex-associated protein-like [Discoglossus pictus]
MDDDDSGLLDFIGDPQALNYFLHGTGSSSADDELSTDFSTSNSNSIFANSSHSDPKSSIKDVHNQVDEGSSDGLQLSNSLQFLDDELESSPIPDLNEDILQKSLNLANITAQTLAKEAYLDAGIGPNQQYGNVPIHSHSSASFSQTSNVPHYSGQTLHQVGVPVVQQQVGSQSASNTVGLQHGFMQHVGISIPSQHMSNSNQNNSGQIHLIGSLNSPSSLMTINNPDGSQIILKSGQQASANQGSGMLVHRQTPNGNSMFGSPNSSPAGQHVTVPFNSGNFQTSLPVQNIIIHRSQNMNKIPINIQPKPIQGGQQSSYNMNNLGIQQHHVHQGIPFVSANSPQNSAAVQQMSGNIGTQQSSRKQSGQQPGGSIVIHSPMGQQHGHPSQFLIPAGLSVNSSSVQHVHTINAQLVQAQTSHLGQNQVSSDHVMLNRNSSNMVRPNQPYHGQMLNSPNSAVQLVPGQSFAGPGGQVIVNQAASQLVGGQMPQVSPTVLHLSPGQGNSGPGRSGFTSMSPGGPNMSAPNRFTVVNSGTVLQSMLPSFQTAGGEHYMGDLQQNRTQGAMTDTLSSGNSNAFCPTAGSQQTFSCGQKAMNHHSPGSSLKSQDCLRQQHLSCNASLTGHNSGNQFMQHSLTQDKVIASQLQNVEVDRQQGGLKRPASRQLTKGALVVQQIHKDQESSVMPDKSQFHSFDDAVQRLLPYHVFQGSLPTEEELQKVDNEFEIVATHILKKTQSMLNKYRLLLLEDAMRINPSAEMVMLDRMFNQEERATLTREKRFAVVDPDGYLAEFCCASKFHEESTDEKQSSNHGIDTSTTTTGGCQKVSAQRDQSDITVSKNHDNICSVPNSLTSRKVSLSPIKTEGLNEDGKLKKIGCSPRNQLLNICKTKALFNEKSTECPSEPGVICKASKEEDNIASHKLPNAVLESNAGIAVNKHLETKSRGSSPESDSGSVDSSESPSKHLKHLKCSKTSKPKCKNVLELKLSGQHFQKKDSGSTSTETELPKCSPKAPQENCVDKTISENREGTLETDSVLEAAVNSILEC